MVRTDCKLDIIVSLIEDLKELPTDGATELRHGNAIRHWHSATRAVNLYRKSGSEGR